MSPVLTKEWSKTAYPKTLLYIVASFGGLAGFLLLASTLLVSQPIGDSDSSQSYSVSDSNHIDIVNPFLSREKSNSTFLAGHRNEVNSEYGGTKSAEYGRGDGEGSVIEKDGSAKPQDKSGTSDSGQAESEKLKDHLPQSKVTQEEDGNRSSSYNTAFDVPIESTKTLESSAATTNLSQTNGVDSDCDLYHGKWIYDSTGPLYPHNSCPVLTQMQNCQGNGRPDKDYENWRWKPSQCDLPRFDAKKFLELMRGKTLAFIGDSVARNQMESLLCILWQVEVPKNRGSRRMQRYYFRSTSTMIVRIWSSWLVHQTAEPFDFAPAGVAKLHLDAPDEGFMEYITGFDVIVLSSGHWFAKQSVYILNNEIVGGQLWWPDNSREKKINSIEAFGVSVETILTAFGTHPNYTGLTIVRSYSPDHYEGGAWNTGGSCTGKERPASKGELVENSFTKIMHEKQVAGFHLAIIKKTNKSKIKLMDITEAFSYRHDGHPGPYRSPDPNKITKRGPDGRPPPQDCLHWCMPGPVDTWNELMLEIIRREFHDRQDTSS
ncbi:protein YLS7 [Sesamum alatum]|uniref:Protein YLS7 n=1 Tax=Sesamum alatum TaxID=300844 RepID=A0AAE2CR82_9LAMI|nr:protein YLS7 [Sesamum alatum]